MSHNFPPYDLQPDSVSVVVNGELRIFSRENPLYDKIAEKIKEQDGEGLLSLLTAEEDKIENEYEGFSVRDGVVFVDDDDLPRTLGDRVYSFAKDGLPYQPLLKLWERLQKNPSNRAVERLFDCLQTNHHPISLDGRLIAWKKVRSNFKDIHSGTFDNTPGTVVEVPRNKVDENIDQTCSYGLHVASWDYAKNHYGSSDDVIVEVVVDPADVVAIPRDYNNMKMRVSKYEVLQKVDIENKDNLYGHKPELEEDESEECPDCGYPLDDCICLDEDDDEECPDCEHLLDDCVCLDEEDWDDDDEED